MLMQKASKEQRHYSLVARKIIYKCAAKARTSCNGCVSFEDLGLKFQDFHCLDLREKGWVVLGLDENGKPGVSLASCYKGYAPGEISELLNKYYSLGYGE